MEVDDKKISAVIQHLDAICTIMGLAFKELLNPENKEEVVGFIIGPVAMFEGDLTVEEAEGVWVPEKKPDDPKQIN